MVSRDTPSTPDALWDGLSTCEDFLRLSDERQWWLARCLRHWREGYAAAELAHADDYDAGYADGAAALKHAQHDEVEELRLHRARWGPGGRQHFADPRPGDYTGGPVPWEPDDTMNRAV